MDDELKEKLRDSAGFVAGADPWERPEGDSRIEIAVSDARMLLDAINGKIDKPLILGGTTVNPDVILSLTWMRAANNRIAGTSATFFGNHTCRIDWTGAYGSNRSTEIMSIENAIAFDLPRKLQEVIETVTNYPHMSKPSVT